MVDPNADPSTRSDAFFATRTEARLAYARGSFFSAFMGWLLVVLPAFLFSLFVPAGPVFVFYYAVVCALIVLPLWLVVLWPLYRWVPRRSPLWSCPVCTLCGLAGGTLIAALILGLPRPLPFLENFFCALFGCLLLGGLLGAATCLCGSLTAVYFLGPVPPDPLPLWVSQISRTSPDRHLERAREYARLRGAKMLRWVSEKFGGLSGQ